MGQMGGRLYSDFGGRSHGASKHLRRGRLAVDLVDRAQLIQARMQRHITSLYAVERGFGRK